MTIRILALYVILLSVFIGGGVRAADPYTEDITSRGLCGAHSRTSPSALAFVDGGRKLYVTDSVANRILIISRDSNSIEKEISTPGEPSEIVVSPDSRTAYVLTNVPTSTSTKSALLFIDTRRDQIIRTLALGSRPVNGLWLSRDGSDFYISWGSTQYISVLSVTGDGRSESRKLYTDQTGPIDPFLAIAGSQVYIVSRTTVDVISTTTGERQLQIPLEGIERKALSVSPDESMLALTAYPLAGSGFTGVMLIRTADNSERANVSIHGDPVSSVFSTDGHILYVNVNDSYKRTPDTSLSVINTESKKIVATVPMKGVLGRGVVSPDNALVYFIKSVIVPDEKRTLIMHEITVLDMKANAIIREIPIPIPDKAGARDCG